MPAAVRVDVLWPVIIEELAASGRCIDRSLTAVIAASIFALPSSRVRVGSSVAASCSTRLRLSVGWAGGCCLPLLLTPLESLLLYDGKFVAVRLSFSNSGQEQITPHLAKLLVIRLEVGDSSTKALVSQQDVR